MKRSDQLAFMPLRYLMPMIWLLVILSASTFSYFYVKNTLHDEIKAEVNERIGTKFQEINDKLRYMRSLDLPADELLSIYQKYKFDDNQENVMGYFDGEGQWVVLQGDKQRFLDTLHLDFTHEEGFVHTLKTKVCDVFPETYAEWINDEVLYLFKPLSQECGGQIQFLRYSIQKEQKEHVKRTLDTIVLYTTVLLIAMVLAGSFSYYIISLRLNRLLSLISGYKQSSDLQASPMGGKDEIAAIANAFESMTHRMNKILDDMYTFVSVLDPQGHILFVNNTPLAVSELQVSDVVGKKLSDTYWWAYDQQTHLEIAALLQRSTQGEIINQETQIQIAGGRLIWITFSIHPVYDANGKIEHLVAEGVDISRQKQAYEEMLQQTRKAQMGEMLSVIAHQWRQPLGVISALTGRVVMESELGTTSAESLKESMDKINQTVTHLGTTMQQFTGFFNPNKKVNETSFHAIVSKSLALIGSQLQSQGVKIENQLTQVHPLLSYEEELIQVVMDLLKNSADFFKENKIENPKLILKEFYDHDRLCLSILDNAGGIPDAAMEHLFDPYFSTKSENAGSGLGLHMSKMIVEDHCGGKIFAKQHNGGAEFIIALFPKYSNEMNL